MAHHAQGLVVLNEIALGQIDQPVTPRDDL